MDTNLQKDFRHGLSDENILIVDDNKSNTLILESMLNRNGLCNTVTLNDSSDFIKVFRKHCPDIVLLDIVMPQLDGFEILEWMKSNNHINFTPVIVITA